MKVLITGGAGFIGSNFIQYLLETRPEIEVVNFDKLTYSADLRNVEEIATHQNYSFVQGDVCDLPLLLTLMKDIDWVVHLAAESHVDNSIGNSLVFSMSNTYGTHVLLEAARLSAIKKFIHVSTDEVYGDVLEGSVSEDAPLNPNNPYSASKAGAEMMVRSYRQTYGMPIIIVRGNNVFGPRQYPEKIIPKFITRLFENKTVPLHGDGSNVRTFIYVRDLARALVHVLDKGVEGEIYNIGTTNEISNLALTHLILKKLKKGHELIEFVPDRPFNDRRYSIMLDKIHHLGWKAEHAFEEALDKTIEWYKDRRDWWQGKSNNDLGAHGKGAR